jgi:hypothetical protein
MKKASESWPWGLDTATRHRSLAVKLKNITCKATILINCLITALKALGPDAQWIRPDQSRALPSKLPSSTCILAGTLPGRRTSTV